MIHIQYINKKEASKVVVYKNQNVYTNTRIEGSWDFRICAAIIKKKCVCARVKINALIFFFYDTSMYHRMIYIIFSYSYHTVYANSIAGFPE